MTFVAICGHAHLRASAAKPRGAAEERFRVRVPGARPFDRLVEL